MVPLQVLLHILANLSNSDLRTVTQQKLVLVLVLIYGNAKQKVK